MAVEKIHLIKIDMIDRPQRVARDIIDPEKVRELAESIRESGLLQPVILRPFNGRYEMVAGDRRYLAHKLLGLKEIKAIVKELDDHETAVVRAIENLQRVDLTPSEEAAAYLLMHTEGGMGPHQIAKKTGRSHATIDRYLRFAKCSEEVRRAVDRKDVSLNVLETLMEVDDSVDFDYFFKMAVHNGISSPVARLWVDDYFKTKAGKYYSEEGGLPGANVEVESKPAYMTCEVCSGPVEIRKVKNVVVCPECRNKVRQINVKTS